MCMRECLAMRSRQPVDVLRLQMRHGNAANAARCVLSKMAVKGTRPLQADTTETRCLQLCLHPQQLLQWGPVC